jgi:predicted nicotinamide N-methyase
VDIALGRAPHCPAVEVGDDAFVRSVTRVTRLPFVPELCVHVAPKMVPIWDATKRRVGRDDIPPPFWAFAWPGGQALARHVLDYPQLVVGQRVLDFAAGGGMAALGAARAGAASVIACDVDPLASVAQQANADLSDVQIASRTRDIVGEPLHADFDVVLAGDVCFEWVLSTRIVPWLRRSAADGVLVLLGDPGRDYLPNAGIERLADYDVPTSRELEIADLSRTTVWRVLPA